jgi:hypothetical protein
MGRPGAGFGIAGTACFKTVNVLVYSKRSRL